MFHSGYCISRLVQKISIIFLGSFDIYLLFYGILIRQIEQGLFDKVFGMIILISVLFVVYSIALGLAVSMIVKEDNRR